MVIYRYGLELLLAFTIAFVAMLGLRVSGACAQSERSSFTDRAGRFSGSSVTHGNKTDFFDARGRYQGTTTQQGSASNPLGNVDGSRPFGTRK
jgi:hypothetical protein